MEQKTNTRSNKTLWLFGNFAENGGTYTVFGKETKIEHRVWKIELKPNTISETINKKLTLVWKIEKQINTKRSKLV